VDDALLVSLGQTLGDLFRNADGLAYRERTARNPLAQCVALVVRHGDELLPIVGLVDLVNGPEVGMIGGRSRLCLADQAGLGFGITGGLGRQEFQGDEAL